MTTPANTAPNPRRVGIWIIGALGSVSGTVALGLALADASTQSGMVTAMPPFAPLQLDSLSSFTVGGHDIRPGTLFDSVLLLHERSRLFTYQQLSQSQPTLEQWSANIRPGVILAANPTIVNMSDSRRVQAVATPRQAIAAIQADLQAFQRDQQLDQVVVVNLASTEPPFEAGDMHQSLELLQAQLDTTDRVILPTSSLYAYAAIDLGMPYVNFTPSTGSSLPALEELTRLRKTVVAGKDGKTGETLLKTALAPMFAQRNLQVLSWVGYNILGNRDGQVLHDPANKASKVKTKDAVLASILGYRPQSQVAIEYIESLDDWKTAWDHIHFEGFLGTKMVMQLTWQGADSILAAPLVLDLARLTLFAQRRGEVGILSHLACFFKSPMGSNVHELARQWQLLEAYLASCV
ncbi:inositol-3-phosphate synthase [Tuwongella immobilis]|uniref:Myo-inositol-1-phosphate synthase GAPDH-like domain-containing protein n=1 Tax=Tuwongella immobilis TaxID=692036 RepID=A0A6C2YSB5_9BACT|nr:inositol-3-phosphate synthase [Tuwongella immobilis]VIP04039.1 myo-inositol-1-phosphate synthase : Putative myo-inositol phosphate synthase OS=Blastopirellula marina DSM 3645 GN=DSM3645_15805 PE=4 SV=1: NAD_binding_5: Inos-1-P_synth [Tuwongella immobilis]VTS05445.1 myo-inositol-1-phosphate synthase : Putative myo-inositol phosphate synthase OS=Blastopirellula marina DSM 3645 GN=DSM3645_15805 PE=4 SV=1: NAD_binding_5: Inos-1-P_synth [Tuwongella immobilis]